jgi:hypothetical protein
MSDGRKQRQTRRALPARLAGVGVLLFLGGFALLQYLTDRGIDPAPGRVLFWGGLALLLVGGGMWLTQPPARSRRQQDKAEEREAERAARDAALANDDDDDLIPCPYCREPIYEESERCPRCGKYISVEDSRPAMPTWVLVGVVVAILITMFWLAVGH